MIDEFSPMLINEPPLQVLPSLARAIGLPEAMLLQQIQYWVVRSKHEHDGRRWIYNTLANWHAQFSFWSEDSIARTLKRLETKGLIITGNFNDDPMDRTKWYTVNYAKLNESHIAESRNATLHGRDMQPSTGATSSSKQETTTQETNNDVDAQKRATAPKKGTGLSPLVDAFRERNLPDPYLEAGNATAAKTLLKTWAPDAIAEFWADVKVARAFGTQFEAERLTLGYIARNNMLQSWSEWKAAGKPAQGKEQRRGSYQAYQPAPTPSPTTNGTTERSSFRAPAGWREAETNGGGATV